MPGAEIAAVAKVLASPTRAQVADALMSERELSVSALASEVGVARSTVSEAVDALGIAGFVVWRRRGRATLVRLASLEVAEVVEAMGRLAPPPAPIGLRAVNRMQSLRHARTCYDHLAGEIAVSLADRLLARGVLAASPDGALRLTEAGRGRLIELGLEPAPLAAQGRRPLVRLCQDWTERRPHVAGRVGAAVCRFWLQRGLAHRLPGSRALRLTPAAEAWLERI